MIPILLFFVISVSAEDDPVMKFYLDKLDSTFQDEYIFVSDAVFDVHIRAIMEKTNYRGEIDKRDTAVYHLFYSGRIDSVQTLDSADSDDNRLPDDFFFLPPWYQEYQFYFFPNDTGAGQLAIGFKPDNPGLDTATTGILSMDRNSYKLKLIMFHDPEGDEYDRLSRAFYFGKRDDLQILLSHERHLVSQEYFGRNYYRQRFEFYRYNFKR